MGADIHIFVECKTPRDLAWKPAHLSELTVPRNYVLFGLLAGVRGDEAMFEPRGLPGDVSDDVRGKFCGDMHTPSWLTAEEFLSAMDAADVDDWTLQAFLWSLEDDGYDCRVVFGFDN